MENIVKKLIPDVLIPEYFADWEFPVLGWYFKIKEYQMLPCGFESVFPRLDKASLFFFSMKAGTFRHEF